MISVKDIGYSYAGQEASLIDVRFELPAGGFLCLAGVNGGGKSTLLALLAGLLRPETGSLEMAGVRADARAGSRELRHVASLVMQEAELQILGSTVEEDLYLGLERDDAEGRARALELVARFGLAELLDRPVTALSHGQKKKLCLATAMAGRPRVLLLDEPFAGLDHPAMGEMRALLRENAAQGLTQVVATHDLEPLADLATHLAVLAHGRLVLFGPPAEVLDRSEAHGVRPPCSWRLGLGLRSWD